MAREILARRRAEREALIDLGHECARRLSARLPVRAAYVAGSVARGDFNVRNDIDVVIVADNLPERVPARMAVLVADAPPPVQPVGFTPEEFEQARARRNPLVIEALERGVVLIEDGSPPRS
ncbi:MAG: nucleotidyltransferase domain-containing protein [Actinomycetota bacterium]|nr:nucleotidyltransferase domain-containing protein [Actinomycetota bacterium]